MSKSLKKNINLSKLLGIVFLVSAIIAGVFLLQNPQFFASDAKTTEGSCSPKKSCPKGYKCSSGSCILEKSSTKKKSGDSTSTVSQTNLKNLQSCPTNCNNPSKNSGGFKCWDGKVEQYCCPTAENHNTDGSCKSPPWWKSL